MLALDGVHGYPEPMEYRVIPATEVVNPVAIAEGLRQLLVAPINKDIQLDFPGTTKRYNSQPELAQHAFHQSLEDYQKGVRALFVCFVGQEAVGLSIITNLVSTPRQVAEGTANVSGFICEPWRGFGFGRLSLEVRLARIKEAFGGTAWTSVRPENSASVHNVKARGFKFVGQDEDDRSRDVYFYRA